MILQTMLQRLFASLVHGPSMNARPHNSRQRCDFTELGAFAGKQPTEGFRQLLKDGSVEFPAKVPRFVEPKYPEAEWSDEEKKAKAEYTRQSKLLKKLRDIAEDARDYMNDHGESCLALGFPLISIPPTNDSGAGKSSSRILAPLLLMHIDLKVRVESRPGITVSCVGEGADLIVANPALLAWMERQTGKSIENLFVDDDGENPWSEIADLQQKIVALADIDAASMFDETTELLGVPVTEKLPKGVAILPSAVVGLFPLSNQSLLRDTRWMIENETQLEEPVASFLKPEALTPTSPAYPEAVDDPVNQGRDFSVEWLVSSADPCQANAVVAAREARALVVHGPPGTGKSQTITNMIADHLARGERVLFVCDKRTALDVVKYRLDALGLGDFCGIVHDPNADRKQFYMGLREQLDSLAEAILPEDPRPKLELANQQLAAVHRELEGYRRKLHSSPDGKTESFHELLGIWLNLAGRGDLPEGEVQEELGRGDVETSRTTLDEIARRATAAGYPSNPLRDLLGITSEEFLALRTEKITGALDNIVRAADAVDQASVPEFPVLKPLESMAVQATAFKRVSDGLLQCASISDLDYAAKVLRSGVSGSSDLQAAKEWVRELEAAPLDRALLASAKSAGIVNLGKVNESLVRLDAWDAVRGSFFKRLFAGKASKDAAAALSPLALSPKTGFETGTAFFKALKPRLLLADFLDRIGGESNSLPDDSVLVNRLNTALVLLETSQRWKEAGMQQTFNADSAIGENAHRCAEQFQLAADKATKLDALQQSIIASGLFRQEASAQITGDAVNRDAVSPKVQSWRQAASTIEDLVRLQSALSRLPEPMREQAREMSEYGLESEPMYSFFLRGAIENELRGRLHSDSELVSIDNDRIEAAFNTFHEVSKTKANLVREYIRFVWIYHQKSRLLASTGTQLNKLGASLRQRLYVRGKKALKLRQMLATGAEMDGGDPIFDLCPVWMASPATVAQIFPRKVIFDVVVFDEASQCRLEEALPVLLRGHRVVIAGDQKQLPPTRFFETALTDSGDGDAESAEELFVQQQSEAEDLLSAALNLDVKEAYLDVHYRSRNEALIGFSNEQYYGSRLQPIPGHPKNKAFSTPITVHQVDGIYEDRANEKEAKAAAELVAELLSQPSPPSIGLACFNLTQRDAILDALGEKAAADPKFAQRLEEARHRKGRDSAEGLFVKNLENVQGDERDVIIISTTFGPDKGGKFRRNFGALSQKEGGRRLNVLVTRSRIAIHVFTSIPQHEYNSVHTVPDGMAPNGRLQLYAYLRYAQALAKVFAENLDELEKMQRDAAAEVKKWDSKTPSKVALSLADALLEKTGTGSHVHWGNEGFCVDVACIHPIMPADVTVGVMTDFTRFHKTPDPIEWDLFRTQVLRSQGWEIHRIWSPVLFRKREDVLQKVQQAHCRLSGSRDEDATLVET